jgi:hypothetical protein
LPEHAPPEFRYIGFAQDFPAEAALEHVLCRFINIKRDAMAESELSEAIYETGIAILEEVDGEEPAADTYPNRDIWLRFQFSRDDLIELVEDKSAAADFDQFKIEYSGDAEWGDAEEIDEGGRWVTVKSYIVFDYSSAALTVRFARSLLGGPIDCLCWVTYAEGDGDDVKRVAAVMGFQSEA